MARVGYLPPAIFLGRRLKVLSGNGDPNNFRFAPRGSVYLRTDVQQLWQNADGARGWVLVGPAPPPPAMMHYQCVEVACPNQTVNQDIPSSSAVDGFPFTVLHAVAFGGRI